MLRYARATTSTERGSTDNPAGLEASHVEQVLDERVDLLGGHADDRHPLEDVCAERGFSSPSMMLRASIFTAFAGLRRSCDTMPIMSSRALIA